MQLHSVHCWREGTVSCVVFMRDHKYPTQPYYNHTFFRYVRGGRGERRRHCFWCVFFLLLWFYRVFCMVLKGGAYTLNQWFSQPKYVQCTVLTYISEAGLATPALHKKDCRHPHKAHASFCTWSPRQQAHTHHWPNPCHAHRPCPVCCGSSVGWAVTAKVDIRC